MKLEQHHPSAHTLHIAGLQLHFSYETLVGLTCPATGHAYKTPKRHSSTTTNHINNLFNLRNAKIITPPRVYQEDDTPLDPDYLLDLIREALTQ